MADTASQQLEQVNNNEDAQPTMELNFGYVLRKLAQAQQNNNERQTEKWNRLIANLDKLSFSGSRTPVVDTPAWVSLEVALGGFTTGNYVAGCKLQEYEKELYKFLFNEEARDDNEKGVRERLNNEMLTPTGLSLLSTMLATQQYDIKVPEEGALITYVYLVQKNRQEEANKMLEQIKPFFSKLRFYPIPSAKPLSLGVEVSIAPVSEVIENLNEVRTRDRALRNRIVCRNVLPSYDKLISVVLSTCGGSNHPRVVKNGETESIEGDLPFQVATKEVKRTVRIAVDELESYSQNIKNSKYFKKHNLGILLNLANKYLASTATPRNHEVARKILATFAAKHGYPGSESHNKFRDVQGKGVSKIGILDDFAHVISARLAPYKNLQGLNNINEILAPVQMKEVQGLLEVNMEIPNSLKDKVNRAKLAPIDRLCEEGLVPSAEILANLCPALVANMQTSGFSDREGATLYGAIYRSFKNRRSLILLNLESQVRIEELPWVSALINMQKQVSQDIVEATKATLEDVIMLALTKWPETMFPNKLVAVLQDLSKTANPGFNGSYPLMKEIAADIFCFAFSQPFLTNARIAAKQLEGTIYEKYYNLDYAKVKKFKTTEQLNDMCVKVKSWGNLTENGVAIEKCMLITTHNLAFVFRELNLKPRLASVLPTFPRRIFDFVIKSTSNILFMDVTARYQVIKAAGFAWRQMVFFLAMMDRADVDEFFAWATTRCETIKDKEFKERIELPLKHLHACWTGEKSPQECIFTGCSTTPHFMMPRIGVK